MEDPIHSSQENSCGHGHIHSVESIKLTLAGATKGGNPRWGMGVDYSGKVMTGNGLDKKMTSVLPFHKPALTVSPFPWS